MLRICLHREHKAFVTHPAILSMFTDRWDPFGYYNLISRPFTAPLQFVGLVVGLLAVYLGYMASLPGALVARAFFKRVYNVTQDGRM